MEDGNEDIEDLIYSDATNKGESEDEQPEVRRLTSHGPGPQEMNTYGSMGGKQDPKQRGDQKGPPCDCSNLKMCDKTICDRVCPLRGSTTRSCSDKCCGCSNC